MPTPRFLTLDDVAEILNVSWSQAYALVRRKELIAIQIGGRGQWRVEVDQLERFIQQKYAEARAGVVSPHPAAAHEKETAATPSASPIPGRAVLTTATPSSAAACTPRTAPARRGSSGACSASSRKSAPTRSIVPLSTVPSSSTTCTVLRSRASARTARRRSNRARTTPGNSGAAV